MRLRHNTLRKDKNKTNKGKAKQAGKVAAAVAALLMSFSPLAERAAMAQDPQPPPASEKTDKDKTEDKKDDSEKPEALKLSGGAFSEPAEPPEMMHLQTMDAALSRFEEDVDITGSPRKIKMSNDLFLGGRIRVTEAASSIAASIRYKRYVDFAAGNMWFGEQAAPFATLSGGYSHEFWKRVKLLYLGRVSAVGNMPSVLYTSHSIGAGYSQPIGDWRLRLGAVVGGALSYDAFDDIYLNFNVGASIEWNKQLIVYAAPRFFFAAKTPAETASVKYYWPRFQDVDMGVQWLMLDNYSGRVFARVGMLGETYGARIAKTVRFSDTISGDFWASLVGTRWIEELGGSNSYGGRWDFGAMAGITIVIGGEYVNTTTSTRYEHLQAGGIRHAETDIPTQEEPGPYGFGRSGNPLYDEPINYMKRCMTDASTFDEFIQNCRGDSVDDTMMKARFLSAFMHQVAYANDAYDALQDIRLFDSEVDRIAGATNDTMFYYLRQYVDWYENHGGEPLPEELRKGFAVCAGIHSLVADYLTANGVPAIVLSVNTPNGPHVIVAAQPPGRTVFIDYGNTYTTPAGTFDQTLRFYGQNRRAPTFQAQIFKNGEYLGTFETAEGRLLHWTIGIPNDALILRAFLGVKDF